MYDGTSRSEESGLGAVSRTAVHGRAEVGYGRRAGVTALCHLYQRDPLRVLFPTPARGEAPTAALVTTSGGLVAGDCLSVAVDAGPNTALTVIPQAAEKVYRSAGADCAIDVSLAAAEGAALEWLPQETILFEGARLRRETVVTVGAGARVLAGEMLVLGRIARGERMTRGLVRDSWEIRRDRHLVWADALHLDGDVGALTAAAAGLGGASAVGMAVYAGDDADAHLDTARSALAGDDGLCSAATVVNGVLVARFLADRPADLRTAYGRFWGAMRSAVFGRPEALPRLWHV